MTDTTTMRRPWHVWAVGAVSLLWNSIGAFDYLMSNLHVARYLAAFTPEQRTWFESVPAWMTAAWALGVWGAIAGSVLLLLASQYAAHAFAVSLAGLIVSTLYQYGVADMPASMTTSSAIMFSALLWFIAIVLLWYAVRMRARGVLR